MTGERSVLVVDDSAVVRQVLSSVIADAVGLRLMGTAADPVVAMQRMNAEWPDVVVLDIEMPRMDGITFLKKLMAVRPTPVVICSTLTGRGATTSVEAMAAGAVAVVTKPTTGLKQFLEEQAADLVATVRAAADGDMRKVKAATVAAAHRARVARPAPVVPTRAPTALTRTTERVVAIGTSTGGTQALETVLTSLPRVSPGIVVVQHMPEHFTAAFAARLDSLCSSEVLEASDGDRVLPGRVLIAPGGRHLTIERSGAQYRARVHDGERVNRHRPSVDVLFESVAQSVGRNALGVIMTGMGDDGARGLLTMRRAGAHTLGQDEASCVVYGMPHVARQMGAVCDEVGLAAIAPAILSFASAS